MFSAPSGFRDAKSGSKQRQGGQACRRTVKTVGHFGPGALLQSMDPATFSFGTNYRRARGDKVKKLGHLRTLMENEVVFPISLAVMWESVLEVSPR